MFARGLKNILVQKPLAVSVEITHSCNANCRHCDKGGARVEYLATPEQYREICRELNPLVAQVSGGEPLLREDVLDVVAALSNLDHLPLIVFVSNGALLTPERYLQLKRTGVDQFSISLDYPDERHDENRRIPGLFQHLNRIIPQIAAMGFNDITLISVIRRGNIDDLYALAQKAAEWGVSINFSAYTRLRTGDPEHFIFSKEDLQRLHRAIRRLVQFKRETGRIITSESVLYRYYKFFKDNGITNCRSGRRHLVINPDGSIAPCAMYQMGYRNQQELIKRFTRRNRCGGCYVSLRANTEKSVGEMLRDFVITYFTMKWSGFVRRN